jgi:2,3-bisphosphoglycerate-independent phosphoglycerate mutase
MTSQSNPAFVVLAILDGWGIAPDSAGNAIAQANTINMDKFWVSYPHTKLQASGEAVGLPKGEDGNTETGHLNLGAGKIVYQDLERINMTIADGSFFENKVFLDAINHTKKHNSKFHLMGLVGAGGVHSKIDHLLALIHLAGKQKITNLCLHLFTDGRDSPPTSAKNYIEQIRRSTKKEGVGKIASIMGRYWAMDRDMRWDRTQKAYASLTQGLGKLVKTPEEAIEASYSDGKTDEFIEPSIIVDENNRPFGLIEKNDSVIFYNFRIDRPRQITKAFVLEDFSRASTSFDFDPFEIKYEKTHIKKPQVSKKEPFKRGARIDNLFFVTMTEYDKSTLAAFPPEIVSVPLGSVISAHGLRQLRITESEKERFVTYYFNGLRDKPFPQEDRVIVPSPAVTTYDQKPEMSSVELTQKLMSKIQSLQYKLIVVNYPNADMVGHTGNLGPAVKAIEVVDECVGKLANLILAMHGVLIIIADHGNAEEMIDPKTREISTEHSSNLVPFIAISHKFLGKPQMLQSGILADIAPTILKLLKLPVPSQMTGRDLLAGLK